MASRHKRKNKKKMSIWKRNANFLTLPFEANHNIHTISFPSSMTVPSISCLPLPNAIIIWFPLSPTPVVWSSKRLEPRHSETWAPREQLASRWSGSSCPFLPLLRSTYPHPSSLDLREPSWSTWDHRNPTRGHEGQYDAWCESSLATCFCLHSTQRFSMQ